MVISIPSIEAFLDAAFARGESVARQTIRLLELLDDYGAQALAAAVAEALASKTPNANSVSFILARRRRAQGRATLPIHVDLSRYPHLADLSVPTHQLEIYDELSNNDSSE